MAACESLEKHVRAKLRQHRRRDIRWLSWTIAIRVCHPSVNNTGSITFASSILGEVTVLAKTFRSSCRRSNRIIVRYVLGLARQGLVPVTHRSKQPHCTEVC